MLDILPASQNLQNEEPKGEWWPGGQGVHEDEPDNENVPAGQGSHPDFSLLVFLPASHG